MECPAVLLSFRWDVAWRRRLSSPKRVGGISLKTQSINPGLARRASRRRLRRALFIELAFGLPSYSLPNT